MNVNAIDAVRTEEVNVNLTERGFLAYKRKVWKHLQPTTRTQCLRAGHR